MQVKKHYELYWSRKKKPDTFWGYERNFVLPNLFSKGEKVLDLGCGDGAVSEFLAKKLKVRVVGADISEEAIKTARGRGVDAVLMDAEKPLPFKNESFDVVFWGDNIEHLFNPQDTLIDIKRVLKKKGRLVISCPNMAYWRYRLYYLFKGRLADTEWSGNPPWAWNHIRFFNISILRELLEKHNFYITKVIGINRRRIDKFLVNFFPTFSGMILVIEVKNG